MASSSLSEIQKAMKEGAEKKEIDFLNMPPIPERFKQMYGLEVSQYPSFREMFVQMAPHTPETQPLKDLYSKRMQMSEEIAQASWATLEDSETFVEWSSELAATGISAEVAGQLGTLAGDSVLGKAETSRILYQLWKPRKDPIKNPNGWLVKSIEEAHAYIEDYRAREGAQPLPQARHYYGNRDISQVIGVDSSAVEKPSGPRFVQDPTPLYQPAEAWAKHSEGFEGPQPMPHPPGTTSRLGIAQDNSKPWSHLNRSWTSSNYIREDDGEEKAKESEKWL